MFEYLVRGGTWRKRLFCPWTPNGTLRGHLEGVDGDTLSYYDARTTTPQKNGKFISQYVVEAHLFSE